MLTLLHIAAIMLPAMVLCALLLYLAGLSAPTARRRVPAPRKRPIDQGPETRFADLLPRKPQRSKVRRA